MFLPLHLHPDLMVQIDSIPPAEAEAAIKRCVQAIVYLGQKRQAIKRNKLIRMAFSIYSFCSNHKTTAALTIASNVKLNKIFALRLYELEDKSRFIMISSNNIFHYYHSYTDRGYEEYCTLYLILSAIFASTDENISLDEIEDSLAPLQLSEDKIKSLIQKSVKRHYLKETKDQESRIYSWGPRAYAEVDPEGFFESFLDLASYCSRSDFASLRVRVERMNDMPNR